MPPRTASAAKKAVAEDNALLQSQIDANKINTPRTTLLAVGLVTAFLPAYIAHAVYYIEITNVYNIPAFVAVIGITAYLLAHAYDQLTTSEFLKRVKHYAELKSESDTKLLKDLRLQASLGYAIFLTNTIFVIGTTVFQTYIFRQNNAYAAFVLSPLLCAAFLWILAEKSMDLRKQKMGVH